MRSVRNLMMWFVCLLLMVGPVLGSALDSMDERFEQRSYRRFLLPNGLKILLVSDPTVRKAAASLTVGVGAMSDPEMHQGLAHYLEHMLFLGTEKYPEAGEYQQFVSNRGGYTNAYTAGDHTNYHFEIDPEHLDGALDRFAQFFTAPLFSTQYLERERRIVDSEHSKNIPNDFRRLFEVRKQTYVPGHPLQKFSTGNLQTLGFTTRDDVIDFYTRYYSSNRMTLAVSGTQSLDELQEMVVPRFYEIVDRNLDEITFPTEYLAPNSRFRLLQVKPLSEIRSLTLSFPLPSTQQYYSSQPLNLLGFLVGHEGKGSLLSLLKSKNLATGLSAGAGSSTNSYSSFEVTVQLTPRGVDRYRDVITHLFQYLRLLREEGLPRYIFNEVQRMNEINYRFSERVEGTRLVNTLSALLRFVPLREVERSPFLLTEFRKDLFDSMLYRLTPNNMLAILVDQGVKVDSTESYYGTEYSYRQDRAHWVQAWKTARRHPNLSLPVPNDFIPQDIALREPIAPFTFNYESTAGLAEENLPEGVMSLLSQESSRRWQSWSELAAALQLPQGQQKAARTVIMRHAVEEPQRLVDLPKGRVWFQPDFRFEQPKGRVMLRILTPEAYSTPRHAVLTQLYVAAIEEGLNEFKYPVSLAGLDFNLRNDKEGVQINFDGYSDRLLELVEKVAAQLQKIQIDQKTFATLQDAKLRSYRNFTLQEPYQQAFYERGLLLEGFRHSIRQYEKIVPDVTLKELTAHARQLFAKAYVEAVVYGNLEADKVQPIMERIVSDLSQQALPPEERFHEQVRQIPAGTTLTFQQEVTVNNSALVLELQQGDDTPENWATLQVLSQWIQPQFYNELRTRQQTGYIVSSGSTLTEETLSLFFLIQSGDFAPDDLSERVRSFLPKLYEDLQNLSQQEFETIRRSVLRASLERPDEIDEATGRLFRILFEEDGDFDFKSDKLRSLASLEHQDFLQRGRQMLEPTQQRQLALQMVGAGMSSLLPEEGVVRDASDMAERLPCPEFCRPN